MTLALMSTLKHNAHENQICYCYEYEYCSAYCVFVEIVYTHLHLFSLNVLSLKYFIHNEYSIKTIKTLIFVINGIIYAHFVKVSTFQIRQKKIIT